MMFWHRLRRRRTGGMWDHITPDDLRQVPAGLCDCDALSWSAGHPRPHAPETCARWRQVRELDALLDLPSEEVS